MQAKQGADAAGGLEKAQRNYQMILAQAERASSHVAYLTADACFAYCQVVDPPASAGRSAARVASLHCLTSLLWQEKLLIPLCAYSGEPMFSPSRWDTWPDSAKGQWLVRPPTQWASENPGAARALLLAVRLGLKCAAGKLLSAAADHTDLKALILYHTVTYYNIL